MSMPLLSTKPTKFTDVNPGSEVEVTHVQGIFEPYRARVLEMKPEYGQHRIPALVLKRPENDEPTIVMSDGTTRVKVLVDSKILQKEAPPANALRVRTIPEEATAVQFNGGVDSAMEIIRFAAGRAAIRWEQETAQSPEALVIIRLEAEERLPVGSYLLVSETAVWQVGADVLATKFELLG